MSAPLWSLSLPALSASAVSTPHRRPLLRAPNAPNACFRCVQAIPAIAVPRLCVRRSRDRWRLSRPARRRSAAPLAIRLRLIRGACFLRKGRSLVLRRMDHAHDAVPRCPQAGRRASPGLLARRPAGQTAVGRLSPMVATMCRVVSGKPSRLRADDPAAARHAAGECSGRQEGDALGVSAGMRCARVQWHLAAVPSARPAPRSAAKPPRRFLRNGSANHQPTAIKR